MIDEEGAVAHFLIVTLALLYLRHALAGLRTSAADTPLRSTASTHQAPMDSPDGGSRPPIQEAVGRVHVAVGLILVAAALHRQVVPETQLKSMQAAAAGGDPSLSQSESPWTPAEGSSRGSGADLLGLRLPLQLIARTSAFSLVSAAADAATFKYGPLMLIANFLLRGGEAAPTRWMGRALKLLLTAASDFDSDSDEEDTVPKSEVDEPGLFEQVARAAETMAAVASDASKKSRTFEQFFRK
eukprot:gene839-1322_t